MTSPALSSPPVAALRPTVTVEIVLRPNGEETVFRAVIDDRATLVPCGPGTVMVTEPDAAGRRAVRFRADAPCENASVRLGVVLPAADRRPFVMIPGAVYDGNRFRTETVDYPPIYPSARPNETAPVVAPIPRLSDLAPRSSLHLLAGGAATPAIGAWMPDAGRLVFLLAPPFVGDDETGLSVLDENGEITLRIESPGVRPFRYRMVDDLAESPDQGRDLAPGDVIELPFAIVEREGDSTAALFRRFAEVRETFVGRSEAPALLPFSAAADLVFERFDADRWHEADGLYYDFRDERLIQPGWVGGGMHTLAMLRHGDPLRTERATRTIDGLVARAQAPSGLFESILRGDTVESDGFGEPHAADWHLLRKSGDFALFLVRQAKEVERSRGVVPPAWRSAIERVLRAFAEIQTRNGRFGQFVNVETLDVVIGGESGAGTVVGALAEGGEWLRSPDLLRAAREAGERISREAIDLGYTCGGPGEILKAPDSESSFGLVEGLVSLWEADGDRRWLDRAAEVAYQALTWTVSYDYRFPAGSTFARMDMRTTGTVIASAQNKHSSPGICTLSALALLKIARATGDATLLDLAADISRALPQFVSRDDRPIPTGDGRLTPSGFVNERVNMSDWELGGIGTGEIFYGSCWPETTVTLTATEMPGVLVTPARGTARAIDHVEIVRFDEGEIVLRNPCAAPARTTVVVDSGESLPWSRMWSARRTAEIAPGETVTVRLGEPVR